MKESVLQNLSEIMAYLLEVVKSGISLVSDNAPDIIIQLLTYTKTKTVLGLSVSAFLFVVSVVILIISVINEDWRDEFVWLFVLLFGFLPSLIAIISFIIDLIKLNTAPTIYLLEYISSLIK